MKTYRTFIYNEKPQWSDVPTADIDCFQWEDGRNYRPRSAAKMCFVRNEGIYVLLMSEEDEIKAVYTKTDEPVYKDSCLEVFLKLGEEGYINIETNANGVYLSGFGKNRNNRPRLKELTDKIPLITPVREGKMWGNEIFVSNELLRDIYPSLGGVHSGTFSGNFYKCGDETHTPHYGSFSPMGALPPGFHNPDLFAQIIVEEVTE